MTRTLVPGLPAAPERGHLAAHLSNRICALGGADHA